jgi:gliding motility-associated-like protein
LVIVLNETTPSDILPLYAVCFDEVGALEIDPGGPFVSYLWTNRETGLVIDTSPTFTTDKPGKFIADLTNGFQCVTSDAFDVIEDCDPRIFGPNALRPTSSIDTNKLFFLNTEYVDKFEIFIHNRWGELIFYSDEKDFTWDGTLNGIPTQNGSYTWVVKFTKEFGGSGETLSEYGGVTVIR